MKTHRKITLRPQHFFALAACGVIRALVLAVSLQLVVNYESRMTLESDFSVRNVPGISVFSFFTVSGAVVTSPFLLLYLIWFPVPQIYKAAITGWRIVLALAQLHPALAMLNMPNVFDPTGWASIRSVSSCRYGSSAVAR